MKKILNLVVLFIMFVPFNKVLALDYNVSLSGRDTFPSRNTSVDKYSQIVDFYVDISNLENIGSLTLNIQYDSNLIGINTCNLFNYIGGGCPGSKGNLYYNYKYSSGYDNYINNYHFYRICFYPIDSTPESGTTNIVISITNAKDRNNQPINISSKTKTYTFTKGGFYFNTNPSSETNENTTSNTEQKQNVEQKQSNNSANVNPNSSKENNTNTKESNENKDEKKEEDTSAVNEKNNNSKFEIVIENDIDFKFNETKTEYDVYVDKGTNSLPVKVISKDNSISYQIIGADDLSKSNNEIKIEINDNSNTKKIYLIHVKEKEQSKLSTQLQNNNEKKTIHNNSNKIKLIIGIVIVIFIATSIIIISRKQSKLINHFWDKNN